MEIISICVTDIPKDRIVKHKNGKSYLNIVVAPKREKDQYGKDLTVYINQTKEEREAKADKIYIGSGETKIYNQQEQPKPVSKPVDDGLPF